MFHSDVLLLIEFVYLKDGLGDMYRGKALAAGHYSCQLRAEPKVSGCNALLPGLSLCTVGIPENVLLKILAGMPAVHFEKGNASFCPPARFLCCCEAKSCCLLLHMFLLSGLLES